MRGRECGLDYNRMFSEKEQQITGFERQLDLAREFNLPVFMHEREGFVDAYRILQKYADVVEQQKVVVHCFTGSKEELAKYIELGCYIGVTGFICKTNRGGYLSEMIAEVVPLDKLMIETDAPFMAPELKNNGKKIHISKNEPGALYHICAKVAEAYGVSFEAAAIATTQNALQFFRVPSQ